MWDLNAVEYDRLKKEARVQLQSRSDYETYMQLAGKGLEIEPCPNCNLTKCMCEDI